METKEPKKPNKWETNKGRWSDPALAREASKKGAIVIARNNKKRAELKKITADKQEFLNNAVDALHADDPEFMDKILRSLAMRAQGNSKDAIQAASLLVDIAGIKAPKQTEVKIEDTTTIEDTKAELERLGVKITEGDIIQ